MKFDGIKLIVATDAPRDALDYALGVSPAERPAWCLVTCDTKTIHEIPANIPCVSFWTRARTAPASAAEIAWEERRAGGPLAGIDEGILDRLTDWKARREAEELRLAYEHVLALDGAARLAADGAPDDRRPSVDGSASPDEATKGDSVRTSEKRTVKWR